MTHGHCDTRFTTTFPAKQHCHSLWLAITTMPYCHNKHNHSYKQTLNSKLNSVSNDITILQSAMSTDSVLDAVMTDAVQSSMGSSSVHETSHDLSHWELSGSTSSTDVSALWCPSVAGNGSSSLPHGDVRLRSLLTSSSGKLCRLSRTSSEKWKPSVTACLAIICHNNQA